MIAENPTVFNLIDNKEDALKYVKEGYAVYQYGFDKQLKEKDV